MKKLTLIVLIFIIVLAGSILYAADPLPSASPMLEPSPTPTPIPTLTPTPTPTLNSLLIQTEQYSFKVTEPLNWRGFSADAAKYYVDAYFCMEKYTFADSPVIMYVKAQKKSGYSAKQHLTWDIDDLKNRNDGMQSYDFRVGDMTYDYAAKSYQTDAKAVTYLCYIDPDLYGSYYLVFTMSGAKEVCDQNRNVFVFLLKSFWWMGGGY